MSLILMLVAGVIANLAARRMAASGAAEIKDRASMFYLQGFALSVLALALAFAAGVHAQ